MSGFFSDRYETLVPYVPGEQPQDRKYIKLNTNESPFAPSAKVAEAAAKAAAGLQLYSDPENLKLRQAMSKVYGIEPEYITMSNGSDEILNFAFMAFADEKRPLAFADITYGFYPVFANINHIPYTEIPLKDDFSIDPEDYKGIGKTVVIANPNAPTGKTLPLKAIREIAESNPENVVIVDEAYVDFGGESAMPLVKELKNVFVTGTFSKSRSMAGARLGFGFADPALIADINTIRYSTNPYNVNSLTTAAGIAALEENDYYMENCRTIIKNREWTAAELKKEGFQVIPSDTNFIFVKHDDIPGEKLYKMLKERGILVRHFTLKRICEYNRITIGTAEQMEALMKEIRCIMAKPEK